MRFAWILFVALLLQSVPASAKDDATLAAIAHGLSRASGRLITFNPAGRMAFGAPTASGSDSLNALLDDLVDRDFDTVIQNHSRVVFGECVPIIGTGRLPMRYRIALDLYDFESMQADRSDLIRAFSPITTWIHEAFHVAYPEQTEELVTVEVNYVLRELGLPIRKEYRYRVSGKFGVLKFSNGSIWFDIGKVNEHQQS